MRMNKKGTEFAWAKLIGAIIALAVLAVMVYLYVLFKGHGSNLIDFINGFRRGW